MPTKVKLGRDQVLSLDGTVLEGVRELDVDIDMTTQDITSWNHAWKSTLPLSADCTVKVLIYWKDDYDSFWGKFNKHPPQPLKLAISNVGSVQVLPAKIAVKQPMQGVLAWEVTLRMYDYAT